jgi:hypothetical protein
MEAGQYFDLPIALQKASENDDNHINKETSRELNKIEINKDEVLQLNNNREICNDIETEIKTNNFVIQNNDKEVNQLNSPNTINIGKIEKIITLSDYDSLSPQDLLKYDKRTNMTFLKDTLISEHSLLSLLFQKSLKNPAFIRLLRLVFSLNIQNAFNALLITDDYIDQRANDPNKVIIKITLSSITSFTLYGIN